MFNVYSLKDWGCPLGSPMNPVKKCQVMLICASLKFYKVLMLAAQVGDPLSLLSVYLKKYQLMLIVRVYISKYAYMI